MSTNVDIFSIPLFYISFKRKPNIEKHYAKYGFKNVNHFPAVDGRKMDIETLKKNNIISIRSYNDLKSGRREHSGLSSLGAVGCTMSHCALWKMCVDKGWPYIIITEEDNKMNRQLTKDDIKSIQKILSKPSSIYLSTNITTQNHQIHFLGLHFYIPSFNACKTMEKHCYPIDVQTDWYMAHLATLGKIHTEGFTVASQHNVKGTSIQDGCFVCNLPKNKWFYFSIILGILLIIFFMLFFRQKYTVCRDSCISYSASSQDSV